MSSCWDPFSKTPSAKSDFYFGSTCGSVNVYNSDSLRILADLPNDSVDMVFADPPYFGNQTDQVMKRTDGHAESFDTQKAKWAFSRSLIYQFDFHYKWLKQAQRILKDGSTIWITGTYHSIGVVNVVLQDLGYKILNEIVLHKRNAPPNFKGTCFRAVSESMLWAKKSKKGKTRFNYWDMKEINGGVQMHNIWEYRAKKNPFRHPATKQPFILDRCIRASTNEGDIILDPFAGSGTTGFVAQGLNRKCVLIEKDQEYCKLIEQRLEGEYGAYISDPK